MRPQSSREPHSLTSLCAEAACSKAMVGATQASAGHKQLPGYLPLQPWLLFSATCLPAAEFTTFQVDKGISTGKVWCLHRKCTLEPASSGLIRAHERHLRKAGPLRALSAYARDKNVLKIVSRPTGICLSARSRRFEQKSKLPPQALGWRTRSSGRSAGTQGAAVLPCSSASVWSGQTSMLPVRAPQWSWALRHCPRQRWGLHRQAGWQETQLPLLGHVMSHPQHATATAATTTCTRGQHARTSFLQCVLLVVCWGRRVCGAWSGCPYLPPDAALLVLRSGLKQCSRSLCCWEAPCWAAYGGSPASTTAASQQASHLARCLLTQAPLPALSLACL